jgi:hypothetical protein
MVSKRSDGFAARESGAATFDWVILAVGVFGLGLAVYSVFTADLDERPPAPQTAIERSAPEIAPLYPYFDEVWRRDQAAYFAEAGDDALLAAYAAQYAVALGEVNARIGADFLMIIEEEMTRRGLPLPDGNLRAAAIRARFMDAASPP